MADGSRVGDPEYLAWERGNIRGLGSRKRYVRTEKDPDGNEVHIYEVEDEEWDPKPKELDYGRR